MFFLYVYERFIKGVGSWLIGGTFMVGLMGFPLSAKNIERDLPNAAQLGAGYKSASDEIAGQCLTGKTVAMEVTGQEQKFVGKKIETTSELAKFLEISLETRASSLDGAFAGDAKASYLRIVKTNSYSLFYAVKLIINTGESLFNNPALKPSAEKLLNDNDLESFRRLCGDYYVKSYKTGGEYHAVIEIKTHSKRIKDEMTAELFGKGTFELFNAEARTKFKQTIERYKKNVEVTLWSFSRGPGVTVATNIEGIEKILSTFPLSFKNVENQFPYKVILLPYETVTARFNADKYRTDARYRRDVLQKIVDEYDNLSQLLNDYNYYLYNVDQFKTNKLVDDIKVAATNASLALDKLAKLSRSCYDDRAKCNLPEVQAVKHTQISLPPSKGDIELKTSCAFELANIFVSDRQGCRHLPSRTTWQFSPRVRLAYPTARMFCEGLRSSDGASRWTLPSREDITHLIGIGSGSGAYHLGIDRLELVWVSEGSAVTVSTGYSTNLPKMTKLLVLCFLDGKR